LNCLSIDCREQVHAKRAGAEALSLKNQAKSSSVDAVMLVARFAISSRH
jgi:hypothetical protein